MWAGHKSARASWGASVKALVSHFRGMMASVDGCCNFCCSAKGGWNSLFWCLALAGVGRPC